MPSELMEQRGVSASSHFHEDTRLTTERQIGFWKVSTMPDHQSGGERFPNRSRSSWTSENYLLKPHSSLSTVLPSFSPGGKTAMSGAQWESSLFSSSLSELYSRKLRLLRNDVVSSQSANMVAAHLEEEEPFESLEEIEAQTIGNLLPDEDDLFNGVIGEVRHNTRANKGDDMDGFDLFSSGGGMELEGDGLPSAGQRNSDTPARVLYGGRGANGLAVCEHPHGEIPSRTLFVRNINSNVENSELKNLFEQYGDIRALYTACKNRGFVMVSYYDIRAAQNAMRALQDKPLRRRKLDIHYSIPKENPSEEDINQGTLLVSNLESSVSKDELSQIFSVYGEIKEIHETTYESSQTFIEFFDVRAAEAALRGLNEGEVEIAGKLIMLEPSRPQDARRFMPQYGRDDVEGNLSRTSFNNLLSEHMARHSPSLVASGSLDGGSIPVLHNPIRSPVNSFIEPHQSFSIPVGLPSAARVMSTGKRVGVPELNHSFDKMKMGNQCVPNLHAHSFSEYYDNFANGSPYKSSRTFSEMVSNGSNVNVGFVTSSIHREGLDGRQIGFNGGVLGSSVNESSLYGNDNMWNNSNSQQQHISSSMIWPHSPSRVSNVPSQRLSPVTAFHRAPNLMVNASSSPVHHHIGSAPAINAPFWDRRHAYIAESPESSSFHLGGSHGNMGYPGSSLSHPIEVASQNIFAHIAGSRMDVNAANSVLQSPQQMSHLFPGRNTMISMPASYDSPSERLFRNLSHRRNDSSACIAEKKHYELDVDRILRGEDNRTTLMIKNIPNKYTSKMLLAAIDEHCKGTYDFIYLPIDFKNKCNVGYAFINLIDPHKIIPLHKAFDGKKWEKFNSEKVASLAYARIQGKVALVSHFQNSSLMNEDKRCRPIIFLTDGPNAGDQEPFPMGANIRSRPGKPRAQTNENSNYQSSFSTSDNREEENGTDSSSKDS